MQFLSQLINTFFDLLNLAILARVLLSWFPSQTKGRFYQFVTDTTQPIINLASRITPKMGVLDFSPLVALIGLGLIRDILLRLLAGF